MLRKLSEHVAHAVLEGIGRTTSQVQERTPLAVDLLESDERYLAVFDAPGATSEGVDVRLEGTELRVRIDRSRDLGEEVERRMLGRGLLRSGSVTLPTSVDADGVSATLTSSGTLRVELPKTEPESDEPIRIDAEENEDTEG